MTTTVAEPLPFLDATPQQMLARQRLLRIMRGFVLDGRGEDNPDVPDWTSVQARVHVDFQAVEATEMDSFARQALEKIMEFYPTARSNRNVPAEVSAVNRARSWYLNRGVNVHHRTADNQPIPREEQTDEARAFAFAMVWFYQAAAWAQQSLLTRSS